MEYLEEFEQILAHKCRQNEPPFCQAACPFQMDIKGLEEKWKKGRFNAAYRTYQNTVGFPGIVSQICKRPCEKACIRSQVDGAISLGLLERATVEYAKRKTPNAYNLPSKGKKVAIVGGGLSGLGCALRLCNKKYEVALFERTERLGGHARSLMEESAFDAELHNQFQFETWEQHLGEEITSLDSLREEYDAIYVATGAGGSNFGLEASGSGAFATAVPGIFMGGSLTGADAMEALAQGLEASLAIERYLKTGGMNEPFRREGTLLEMNTAQIERREAILPGDGVHFTPEEAQEEIGRCLRCSCDACMKACDLMRLHEKTPRRIYEEIYITIHPGTLSRDGTWATRLITTCDQCGLCKAVCPQNIDFGKFFLQSHQAMHNKGAMPWAFHDFWLRDMAFSSGEAKICRMPEGAARSRYAFFPGCQLAASDARYVTRTYDWLLSKKEDTALWMTCCGTPAEWAADEKLHGEYIEGLRKEWKSLGEPEVIFACPNCRKMFKEYLPEIPGVFLSQVMEEWGINETAGFQAAGAASGEERPGAEEPASSREVYSVFDPCSSRDFPALQESVRNLVDGMGIAREELPYGGGEARCCGYGGHIHIPAPNYTRRVVKERIASSDHPYITYCVNCRESFASQGKEVVHFLDLVFGLNEKGRPAATVTGRRKERLAAKRELLERHWHETVKEEEEMNLLFDEELERKLSESQILISDMEQVVKHCEETGRGVINPETGRITGHLKILNMTYWAEYEVLPDGRIRLWNGYSHRMNLEGE